MGHLPFVFMERGDLPPGDPIRQARARSHRRCRALVMTEKRDTKLQHSTTIFGGRRAMAVTVRGINDKLIPESFQTPNFCSKTFRLQRKRRPQDGMI